MTRKSVWCDKDVLELAIADIYALSEQGKTIAEIVTTLSPRFMEREIKELIGYISGMSTPDRHNGLKLALKASLWILLFSKLLAASSFPIHLETTLYLKLFSFILIPSLNLLLLFAVYKETSTCYELALIFLALSLQGLADLDFGPGLVIIFIQIFVLLGYLTGIYSSFRLFRIFPYHFLKTYKVTKKLGLEFSKAVIL
ncbi:MAG TPA: hypothetical protein VLX91_03470 [Candidatus Acidoferrales bacterium]|nr:hypothetical protein [Candidatus Acidoferrales bacterium]